VLGTFFEILDRAFGLRMMAGSGGELAVAHLAQLAAQRLDGDINPFVSSSTFLLPWRFENDSFFG
jgi:hypothetical protein